MDIHLVCRSANERNLKSDIGNFLSKNIKLPVEVNPVFETKDVDLRGSIAISDYRKYNGFQEWGRIEFDKRYFLQNYEERFLTFLHELIHIKLVSTSLLEWNKKKEKRVHEIQVIYSFFSIPAELKKGEKRAIEEGFKKFGSSCFIIFRIISLLDEIWAEMYLKEDYPDFFNKRIDFLCKLLKAKSEGECKTYIDRFEDLAKYAFFYQLLKARFYLNLKETNDLKKLYNEFKQKLDVLLKKEKKIFEEYENKLTDISLYPDSKTMEESFFEFTDFAWNTSFMPKYKKLNKMIEEMSKKIVEKL